MSTELKSLYDEIIKTIEEIDVRLDSVGDQETATKRKMVNELVSANEETWSAVADKLVSQMKDMDPAILVGVYTGLRRALDSNFSEVTTKTIADMVENAPKAEVVVIPEDELKELQAKRSELYQNVKNLVELAKNFVGEEWPMPKTRRGSKGPRGKRALSLYDWAINGQAVEDDDNSVAGVAKLLGYDKAAEFTKDLREAKIDTKSPPTEFSVELRGKVVSAVRGEDDSSSEDDAASEDTSTDDE